MTFAELKDLLFSRSNFGMKLGLERMREACTLLGNPQRSAPALHVAGTNGKGSTCAFAEASLRAAGLRTGLYTSPHLVHFCERIRIAGAPIAEERACDLMEELLARIPWALRPDGLTFFEIATLMAFCAFRGVDVMVIEVGLGGRLDATNVLETPRACAIASLGLDHAEHLGPTLADIAREKAGIFKRGVPAVTAPQPREAARALEGRATEVGVTLLRPGREYRFESRDVRPFWYQGPRWAVRATDLALQGHHQRTNAALACALLEASLLPLEARHVQQGLAMAIWPGRLERIGEVYLDGAHNAPAAKALARAMLSLAGGAPVRLVFGALQDKDASAMLLEVGPIAASVHFCAPPSPRAIAPEALSRMWPGSVHASVTSALRAARGEGGIVLVCGSLYLVGEARMLLLGRPLQRMPSERL